MKSHAVSARKAPSPWVYAADFSRYPDLSVAGSSACWNDGLDGTARNANALAHAASFAAMRSATMIVVTLVATDGMSGRIDASTTRNASTPRTLPQGSTTAVESKSAPIGTVEVGCK